MNKQSCIDRFCRRHPAFGIQNLMLYVSIANAMFWLIGLVWQDLLGYIMFSPAHILQGQIWRLFSFAFYPPSSGILAPIAIYFYYWVGTTLERNWGTAKFSLYFFTGLVLTIIFGFLMFFIFRINFNLSATYIYLSMFFSYACLFPDNKVLLYFLIPIKMKWLALVEGAFFVYEVFASWNYFPSNFMPVVGIANFMIFCSGNLLGNRPARKTSSTLNFKRESERIRKEQSRQLYHHKCAVCGRTDIDNPNLQFRYCSRCAGYHCFCEDHINNHVHFSE